MNCRFLVGHVVRWSLVFAVVTNIGISSDWSRFRGPNGSGVSSDTKPLPIQWNDSENLKWKIPLPGPGSSSPIIVGDRVFVTCWSGYGTDRGNPGDQKDLRRHVICLDRNTGKTIWSNSIEPVLPEDRYGGMFAQHGYASHTPVSDGERIYVYFGKSGAYAFDLDGKQLWQTKIGIESDPRGWGSASSPILYKNLVIITAAAETEGLVGLDKNTGKQVWRQEAQGLSGTWGTPVLVDVDAGRTDMVLGVPYEIWGFNPETGKLRWYCEAMDTDSFCSSVIADGGIVYGIEGRGGGSIALRPGGTGDVSKSHVVWSGRDSSRIGTPVIHEGRLYFFSNRVAKCTDAATGKEIYQTRLASSTAQAASPPSTGRGPGSPGGPGGPGGRGGPGGGMGSQDYASPIIADGKLYYVTRTGEVFVIQPGPTFKQLAVNQMTTESEDFSATPAASDGHLFIRSSKHLYCVATTK